jgi:SAM-dependent methyltransferase
MLVEAIRRCRLQPWVKSVNRGLRRLAAIGHKLQFDVDWKANQHPPEWFDHFTDQYWKWYVTRNPLSWERGVFGMLAMKPGCRVLDLCCGGGFFSYHFFSSRASSVIAVDFDPAAIAHARRNFKTKNIDYRCADIRTQMPEGQFENVVWDAAIEHFTEAEIRAIFESIKKRLAPNGVLNGYTLVEKQTGKSHFDHEYEFKSKEDLANLLKKYFANVLVFENQSSDLLEERRNLYFFASEGELPFDPNWQGMIRL